MTTAVDIAPLIHPRWLDNETIKLADSRLGSQSKTDGIVTNKLFRALLDGQRICLSYSDALSGYPLLKLFAQADFIELLGACDHPLHLCAPRYRPKAAQVDSEVHMPESAEMLALSGVARLLDVDSWDTSRGDNAKFYKPFAQSVFRSLTDRQFLVDADDVAKILSGALPTSPCPLETSELLRGLIRLIVYFCQRKGNVKAEATDAPTFMDFADECASKYVSGHWISRAVEFARATYADLGNTVPRDRFGRNDIALRCGIHRGSATNTNIAKYKIVLDLWQMWIERRLTQQSVSHCELDMDPSTGPEERWGVQTVGDVIVSPLAVGARGSAVPSEVTSINYEDRGVLEFNAGVPLALRLQAARRVIDAARDRNEPWVSGNIEHNRVVVSTVVRASGLGRNNELALHPAVRIQASSRFVELVEQLKASGAVLTDVVTTIMSGPAPK